MENLLNKYAGRSSVEGLRSSLSDLHGDSTAEKAAAYIRDLQVISPIAIALFVSLFSKLPSSFFFFNIHSCLCFHFHSPAADRMTVNTVVSDE
jgi:hypothetical protein